MDPVRDPRRPRRVPSAQPRRLRDVRDRPDVPLRPARRRGARHAARRAGTTRGEAARRQNDPFLPLAAGAVLWLAAAGVLAVPVLIAEGHAAAGDERLRTGNPAAAAQAYRDAAGVVPYNAEYSFRAAGVLQSVASPDARQAFDAAIAANPAHSGYRASRGRVRGQPAAARPRPRPRRLRRRPLARPRQRPHAPPLRRRPRRLGLRPEAKAQYETALSYNDQLPAVEIERLPPAKVFVNCEQ